MALLRWIFNFIAEFFRSEGREEQKQVDAYEKKIDEADTRQTTHQQESEKLDAEINQHTKVREDNKTDEQLSSAEQSLERIDARAKASDSGSDDSDGTALDDTDW